VFLTVFFVSLFDWKVLMAKVVVVVDLLQFLPAVAAVVVMAQGLPSRHLFLIGLLSP
jgi:hypothetical protein